MSDYQMFEAVVRDVEQITPLVKRFTLVSPTGAPLPAFSGGRPLFCPKAGGGAR
ncbi:ferredoxin--NADP(+) reductase, partial [Klebsiella pneumoniae]